jgi:hypothetical protein
MKDQYRLGAPPGCQVAPEFVERYMLLLPATAILFPSADAATELQLMPGPVFVQVWANARLTAVNQPVETTAISNAILVFISVNLRFVFASRVSCSQASFQFCWSCATIAHHASGLSVVKIHVIKYMTCTSATQFGMIPN